MNIGVEIITVIAEIGIAWYFYDNMLGHINLHRFTLFGLYFFYGISLASFTFLVPIAFMRIILMAMIMILVNMRISQSPLLKTVYAVFLFFLMATLADVICGALFAFGGVSFNEITGAGTHRLVYNCTCKIMHLTLLYILQVVLKLKNEQRILINSLPLMLCQFVSLYMCYQNFFYLPLVHPVSIATETLCLLYINITICCYVDLLRKSYESKERAANAEMQLEIQKNNYRNIMERQDETRSLWHDIKKYMNVMEVMVQQSTTEDSKILLSTLQESFSAVENFVDVGNPLINSVLTYGLERASKVGVEIQLDVWVEEHLDISPFDIYIIIGNTLDNAIEACSILPQHMDRIITVVLHQINHMLYYEIVNPFLEKVSKKPGMVHGYGLKNVLKYVQKNNGTMQCSHTDSRFSVIIQISL